MNFAFLASIAWFFSSNEETPVPNYYAKDRFVDGAVYIIQNEWDGNIMIVNTSQMVGQTAAVTTDRWKVTTRSTWLLTTSPYPLNETYILRPTSAVMNRVTNAKQGGQLRNDYFNHWKLEYGGRSFGAEKWLIIHAGFTGDPIPPGREAMCLENHGRGKHVIHRPCNKEVHQQRWKLCLFQHPQVHIPLNNEP